MTIAAKREFLMAPTRYPKTLGKCLEELKSTQRRILQLEKDIESLRSKLKDSKRTVGTSIGSLQGMSSGDLKTLKALVSKIAKLYKYDGRSICDEFLELVESHRDLWGAPRDDAHEEPPPTPFTEEESAEDALAEFQELHIDFLLGGFSGLPCE